MSKLGTSNNFSLKSIGFSVSFYNTISEISEEWNLHSGENLFLKSSFLSALEEAPPSGTQYRYAIVKKDNQVVGVVYYQLKKINLYLSLKLDTYITSGFKNNLWHSIKSFLAKGVNKYVLVNGNMTLTGNNGFQFDSELDIDDLFSLVDEVSDELVTALKNEKLKVSAVLLKDYTVDEKPTNLDWDFSEFQVQPNMVLDISDAWATFDDYLMSMKSKYRVRVRRARKKAETLEKRQLSLEEIKEYTDDISGLYQNVANQAGFNLFILPKNYFYSLQRHLGDRMKLIAYFQNGKMVGYYTNILSHGDLDAHFLGYDPVCNKECQLYLNMLYDLVEDAIASKANKLILSRTAMEIKSSIGAEAHEMYLYMQVINPIFNKGVSRALDYFKPDANWTPRSPFK